MSDKIPSLQTTISLDELKAMIHDAVRDALLEMLGEDMTSEPNFAPEIAERLRKYQQMKPHGISIDDVVNELGLDV
jgi:hypothetical protein